MKRLFSIVAFITSIFTGAYAATDDIALYIKDIVTDWSGGGGSADLENNSYTYKQYATNYWDIHDLSTDIYDKLDITFARPVNYSNIYVTATYSDGSSTANTIVNGSTAHTLPFDSDKVLVKLALSHGWDGPAGEATIYFDSIIIRAKDSTGQIGGMPVKSPKLGTGMANPLLDFQFCADPTAIEYDGRLYVYGTNDHQQYDEGAPGNTYEKIKSLVMISTDDMENWTYHGLIPVGEIAPWIQASWAPSIISRREDDGSTLFSLYFSNSGWGTGVLQASSPVGPWISPLSTSLIDGSNPVVAGSGSIFDPGAVVDGNGDAWIAFGNGQGWIAKLNPDMHSFAADPVKLPSPFHFEANELNYINGTYVYTYNTDWSSHDPWTWGGTKPTACSMICMKSTDPLNTNSWTYGGNYFKNPGENGLSYTNNHTHLHKYGGKWYLFYQMNMLQPSFGASGGFRSIYVDEIEVDEQNVVIKECIPTLKGVTAIKQFDPCKPQYAATAAATLGVLYKPTSEAGHMVATVGTTSITAPVPSEGIIEIRNVNFTDACKYFKCLLRGDGSVTMRIDNRNADDIITITADNADWREYSAAMGTVTSGTHTVYLILRGDAEFDTWQLAETEAGIISAFTDESDKSDTKVYDIRGQCLPSIPQGVSGIYIVNGKKVISR